MHTQPIAPSHMRARFRRFFSTGRRFWDDGRHAGLPYLTRRRCFASAAERHGIPAALFDRLYEACFAERRDRMAELHEHLDGLRAARDPR